MKNLSGTVLTILVLSAGFAVGQDPLPKSSWSSFRNGDEQRGIAGSKLAEKPELLWELKSADGWMAGVAIVDGRVYAPALEGYVYCLDLRTGKEIWKYRSIENPDPKKFAAGFKAAPRVTSDTVYVGDEDGFFHAIDRKTGKKKWIFETNAEIAGCAAVSAGKLLIPSHDASLYCVDPKAAMASAKKGEPVKALWNFETQDRVNCSPALAGNFTFVAGCDEHLRVIDIKERKEIRDIPLGSYLIASPALHGDMLYVGTYTGEVVAVNWKTAEFVWRYKGPRDMEFHASAAVTDELVLVGGHDKTMHCINRKTGEAKWTFPTRARINSSAAIVDRRVFFGSDDGNVYGLSLKDGKEVWKFTVGKDVSAGVAVGDNCLVVGSSGNNGRLYCFGTKAAPAQQKTGASKDGSVQANSRMPRLKLPTTVSQSSILVHSPDMKRYSMPNLRPAK